MRTVRTVLVTTVATAIGITTTTSPAQADPATEEITVICEGVGDDTVTVTGDLADGGTAELPADGPLTIIGEPGFTGETADGTAIEVEPTGEGVTCTASVPTTAELDEILPAEQARLAAASEDQVTGRLTFAVDVDEDTVNAAAEQRSMAAASASNRFPFEAQLARYLSDRPGATGVAVRVPGTDEVFRYTKTSSRNVTASIVKVEIMAGVMLKAQDAGRSLTSWEKSKIIPMIRYSDNNATTQLYTHIGRKNGLTRVSQRLGLTHTYSDPADHWGLTSTVPEDQARLMEHFSRSEGSRLSNANRSYGMLQMRNISSSQDWGVTAGPPRGSVALKNGWLPRTDGWHVNSVGAVEHDPYDYSVAVLTHDRSSSGTQSRQIATIEGVSRIVHSNRARLYEAIAAKQLSRFAGANRYETAAEISRGTFAPGVDVAYVARGTNFPDALAVAPFAARQKAPVLLTTTASLPATTVAELQKLRPNRIVVLGDARSVSDSVVSSLRQHATTGSVTRVSGSDRYATAVAVSQESHPRGAATVFIASGAGYPDALAAAPAARQLGAPVLLTRPDSLPPLVAEELTRLSPTKVVVLGGTPSVATSVIDEVRAAAPGTRVERWHGSDRYETAAVISRRAGLTTANRAYVASGENFPDALAVAPVAGYFRAPLYLTRRYPATPTTLTGLRDQPLSTLRVIGSTPSISSYTAYQLSTTVD